jgi:hypothetical protein
MKKFAFGFAVIAAIALSGCGQNDCDKVASDEKTALDAVCAGKDTTCTSCKCYNAGQVLDVQVNGTTITYACKAATTTSTTTTVTCDGTTLSAATTCLNDETTCFSGLKQGMTDACTLTKI